MFRARQSINLAEGIWLKAALYLTSRQILSAVMEQIAQNRSYARLLRQHAAA